MCTERYNKGLNTDFHSAAGFGSRLSGTNTSERRVMKFDIRDIRPDEYDQLGSIMVNVYSALEGFPKAEEQPQYYEMLKKVGKFSENPETRVLIAHSPENGVLDGIVYYSDMAQYEAGGSATSERNSSGIRLLGVRSDIRGAGIGKALATRCIDLAKDSNNEQIILHTTKAMKVAWSMYDKLGFERSSDLDFLQGDLSVFGFRYKLRST